MGVGAAPGQVGERPRAEPADDVPARAGPADEAPAGSDRRLVTAVAALCAVAFVVFVASPVRQNHDAYLSLPTAYTIVHDRTLDLRSLGADRVQDHYGMVDGPAGARVNYFPWVLSLVAVPAVVLLDAGRAAGLGPGARQIVDGGPMDLIGVVIASVVAVALIALVAAIAADRLDRGLRRRRPAVLLVAGGLAFGTGVWSVVSRALWQHGPSMLALGTAVWCLQRLTTGAPHPRAGRLAAGAGAALAASYTFRPTNAAVVAVLTIYVAARHRELLLRYALGAFAVAVPWLAVNVAAFGSLLQPYYGAQRIGLHAQLGEALAANLVSPNRGLLALTPIVLLAPFGLAARGRRLVRDGLLPLDRLLAVAVALQLLAASAYGEKWWAGNSYGARFLTDVLVLLAVLAVGPVAALLEPAAARPATATATGTTCPSTRRRVLAGVAVLALGWSLFTASQGAVVRATACWHDRSGIDEHPGQVWSWHPPQALAGVARLRDTGSLRATVLDDCGPA